MTPLFDSITLLELCDNLLVTLLVCCTALMFKKEAALRLLAIIAILSGVQFICIMIGFTSTAAFLQFMISSLPIILAIMFQSDIKRLMFSSLRRTKNALPESPELTETVDELAKGLHEMAERRIGALIVIIRQMSIDHLIQVGTEIDAKVTSELLNSIFLPYSPIHDGAVIIQRDKITRAGCILPLSHNPDISRSFGTRHRAALGLTEQSDALVLVVSEETGKISIVHEGKITYDADPTEIRRLSRKAIEGRRAPRTTANAD
jgi:uncharacterized protein (TIGR00159 family)